MRFLSCLVLAATMTLAAADECGFDPEGSAALKKHSEDGGKRSLAESVKASDELAARYPSSFDVQSFYLGGYRYTRREAWPAYRDSLVKRALGNPEDKLAATLAAMALHRTDTPRAIELLEKVAPSYSPAALKLAEFYQAGRFENTEKSSPTLRTLGECVRTPLLTWRRLGYE
ncbi:MAG TPA: hypothetical protein VES20_20550 [Bryobacteraceae bacterium]|nr:hypothetical protein [Bryobacteraceae bacterium]